MKVSESEYIKMFKNIDGMIFTPRVNVIQEEIQTNGESQTVVSYDILATADEVYKEFLNQRSVFPTMEDRLESIEAAITAMMEV